MAAVVLGMQNLLSGELGSQAQPFRYHLMYPMDDDQSLMVESDPDHRENALCLQSTEDWEVILGWLSLDGELVCLVIQDRRPLCNCPFPASSPPTSLHQR